MAELIFVAVVFVAMVKSVAYLRKAFREAKEINDDAVSYRFFDAEDLRIIGDEQNKKRL